MSSGYPGATAPVPTGKIWVNTLPTNWAWASLVLKNIGAPQTDNNIQNLLLWMSAENKPTNWANRNNPLNASLNTAKKDGTGTYANLTTAATNTAAMIVYAGKNSNSNLGKGGKAIYESLMSDAPTAQFSNAVASSNWSSNHYGVAAAGSLKAVPGRLGTWLTTFTVPAINASTAPGGDGYAGNVSAALHIPGCAAKGDVFGGVFGIGKITHCNLKAMQGAFCAVAGGVIIIVGFNLLTKGAALTALPVGKAAKAAELVA